MVHLSRAGVIPERQVLLWAFSCSLQRSCTNAEQELAVQNGLPGDAKQASSYI